MAIITLTSDFGIKDHTVAAVKGAIYCELKDVTVVDISHKIAPFNIIEAGYIICNSYQSFPKGTIHIIGVDAEISPENSHIAVLMNGHYFLCANNGLMSMICQNKIPEQLVEINIHQNIITNFPVLDVFVKVACHLARGGKMEVVGNNITNLKPLKNIEPFVNDQKTQIVGRVIYIDNYGNVITNIKRDFFEMLQKKRSFEVAVRNYKFKQIYKKYTDIVNFEKEPNLRYDEGRRMALFNSNDYLEIAIYRSNNDTLGGASSLLGLKIMDAVSVMFF